MFLTENLDSACQNPPPGHLEVPGNLKLMVQKIKQCFQVEGDNYFFRVCYLYFCLTCLCLSLL